MSLMEIGDGDGVKARPRKQGLEKNPRDVLFPFPTCLKATKRASSHPDNDPIP